MAFALAFLAGIAVTIVASIVLGQIVYTLLHAFDSSCPCGKRWVL